MNSLAYLLKKKKECPLGLDKTYNKQQIILALGPLNSSQW